MSLDQHARGGAPVAVLDRMTKWETQLVTHIRLWCDSPWGQEQVRQAYRRANALADSEREFEIFDDLLRTITATAQRPLVRHDISCTCVGADEGVLVNLIAIASDGHLTDAALIATLLVRPSHAEHVALLAGHVGESARRMHAHKPPTRPASTVVRLQ